MARRRFCTTCNEQVEGADGFCLLGHSLDTAPRQSPFAEARTRVDQAFASVPTILPSAPEAATSPAGIEVAGIEAAAAAGAPPTAMAPAPPAATATAFDADSAGANLGPVPVAVGAPAREQDAGRALAPAPRPPHPAAVLRGLARGDAPPPPPQLSGGFKRPGAADPISSFSPPARIDWGPSRRLRLFRRA